MIILRARAYVGPNVVAAVPVAHLLVKIEGRTRWPDGAAGVEATAALLRLLPGLANHPGEARQPGGFVAALRDAPGPLLAYVTAHVAAELQGGEDDVVERAGMRRRRDRAQFDVFFGYEDPDIGLLAGQAAAGIVTALLPPARQAADRSAMGDAAERILEAFRRRSRAMALDPMTRAVIKEAEERDIPWFVLDRANGVVQLGQGHLLRRFGGGITDATPAISTRVYRNRTATHRIFAELQLPVPRQASLRDAESAVRAAGQIGYPVVVKPVLPGAKGATRANLQDEAAVRAAFETARQAGPVVIVERHIAGYSHRIVCVAGNLVAATQLRPGGAGRDAIDVTAQVHPENRWMLERAARVSGLDVVEIDFVTPDIAGAYRDVGGAICGIDPSPNLHPQLPAKGARRDLPGVIVDRLFPQRHNGRIPTAAVTGTNGKTTTSRMLAHILRVAGADIGARVIGRATTEGVHIDNRLIAKGDYAGGVGARMLLRDPSVEAAVLETARGGLVKIGMAVAWCDVGAVLNIADDHLGLHGLETLEDLAAIKQCVAQAARKLAVLNADDPRCLEMAALKEPAQTCLFTINGLDDVLRAELAKGCLVIHLENHGGEETICLRRGETVEAVIPTARIPATLNGAARHNVQNAMAAVGLAHGLAIPTPRIAAALAAFKGDASDNPGRLNIFEGYPFKVVHDSAHNPHGMRVACEALRGIPASGRRICVVSGIATRHGEHIEPIAEIIADQFDVFICSRREKVRLLSEVTRDFPLEEVPARLAAALIGCGVDPEKVMTIDLDTEAVDCGLEMAREGDLLVLLTGMVDWTGDRVLRFADRNGTSATAPQPLGSMSEPSGPAQ